MNVMKKLKDARKNRKGFTLVELIVVLVILAILAAIMVPALTKWIDKAREKQYVIDARSIYLAVQAKTSEKYATDTSTSGLPSFTSTEVQEILDLAATNNSLDTDSAIEISYKGGPGSGSDAYTVEKLYVPFTDKVCILDNGTWTVADSVDAVVVAGWSNLVELNFPE